MFLEEGSFAEEMLTETPSRQKSAASEQEAASLSFLLWLCSGPLLPCGQRLGAGKVQVGFAEFQPRDQRTDCEGWELTDDR